MSRACSNNSKALWRCPITRYTSAKLCRVAASPARSPNSRTHELRNEVVEELNSDLVSQSGANLDSKLVRGNKNSGMENEKGRRAEKSGERGQGASLGEASLCEARG